MKLSDLIPAEFFAACPVAFDATHGRLSVIPDRLPHAGKVLVEWGQRCPKFKENLAAARELKGEGYGTYNPSAGGWVFHRNAAELCHEKFAPTLERTPEFLALVASPDGKNVKAEVAPTATATAAPASKPHGAVKLHGNCYLVQWGGQAGFCPRDAFDRYLNAARGIKADYAGSTGWSKPLNGWLLARKAAGAIARCFPAAHFTHCPELAADAAANPEPGAVPANAGPREPDAYAARLLAAADRLLAEFA